MTSEGVNVIRECGAEGYPFYRKPNWRPSLESLLVGKYRDNLIRADGTEVKVDSLKGKIVGLFFSSLSCDSHNNSHESSIPNLVDFYYQLQHLGIKFEIVFVSQDENIEFFNFYFSKMPWLAIPYSDSVTRAKISEYRFTGSTVLEIWDENGINVLTTEGERLIREYGVEGFPFDYESIVKLESQDKQAMNSQSIKGLLASRFRDYVVNAHGQQVRIGELEGKTVGLYFVTLTYIDGITLSLKLVEMYKKLRRMGVSFEIVVIPLFDTDENAFRREFENFPWLILPVGDGQIFKIQLHFEINVMPALIVIGPDGKFIHSNVGYDIEKHYPFTPKICAKIEGESN